MATDMHKLNGLDATFQAKVLAVVSEMEKLGWHIRIVWGLRTKAENDALVSQGVASPTSKHLDGKAVDMIDTRVGYDNSPQHKYYQDLGRIAKKYGLVWGGDWISRWDPCHIEMP